MILTEYAVRKAGCVILVGFDGKLWYYPKNKMPDDLAGRCRSMDRELVMLLRARAACREIPLPRQTYD